MLANTIASISHFVLFSVFSPIIEEKNVKTEILEETKSMIEQDFQIINLGSHNYDFLFLMGRAKGS